MRTLVVWLINAVALLALPYVFSSITVDTFWHALFVAVVLGFVNALIRPLLILLTLPATILTLGLFIFVMNGLLLWAVGSFLPGCHVGGFWSGVFGAIVFSLISWVLSSLLLKNKQE